MLTSLANRLTSLKGVPSQVIVITVIASYGGIILAAVAGWPLWGIVLAALLPWGGVLFNEVRWTYRHYGWLALFYLLAVTQGGHLIEHLTQYLQVNVFGLTGPDASGIFGALDTEWVHFIWNTWVLAATIPLVLRYRSNPWLYLALFTALWHELEHSYLIYQYVTTGLQGNPGLLADGGVIAGGLSTSRVNLHFYYNVVETLPLFAAFGWTLRHSYNEWVASAFEGADEATLIDLSERADIVRVAAGDDVVVQGDAADAFYVVSHGRFEVCKTNDDGGERRVTTLGPGSFFGEMGLLAGAPRNATVRALEDGEVVRVDRRSFQDVVDRSDIAVAGLRDLAASRAAPAVSTSSA